MLSYKNCVDDIVIAQAALQKSKLTVAVKGPLSFQTMDFY